MLEGKTIGFLGAGALAEALIGGLVNDGAVRPEQLLVINRSNRARLESLAARFGVRIAGSKGQLVRDSDVVVVACKPKDVADLLQEVGGETRPGQILLSVVAGASTSVLASMVAPGVRVVRAMPNTSSQVRESATAISLGKGAGEEAGAVCRAVLEAVGNVVFVPESLQDAVTGLSGSGPAYVYLMVEALIEAGQQVGLSGEDSRVLVLQTLLGAAKTLVETGEDPAVLRQKVTSPGGTTAAGLGELEKAGFRQALVKAVARATERSRELGALVGAPDASGNA